LRWVADILLFVLEAHKVMRSSVAPSEKVLVGHRMSGLTETPLQPSQTPSPPRGAKVEIAAISKAPCAVFGTAVQAANI